MKSRLLSISLCTLLTSFLAASALAQDTQTDIPVQNKVSTSSAVQPLSSDRIKNAHATGKWKWSEKDGLRPENIRHADAAFWAAPQKLAYDGTIRAILNVGKRPDSSIFFRASFPENAATVTGYSLSFDRSYVQLHRWDGGYPQTIGSRITLKSLPKRFSVTIVMKGPSITITLVDPDTHAQLATFALDDARYQGNQTGYRVHKKQDSYSSLVAWDFTPASSQSTPIPFSPDAYLSQYPESWVLAPKSSDNKSALDKLKKLCKAVTPSIVDNYNIYKCKHSAMKELIDQNRNLPKGFYWTDKRNDFSDAEYRKAALDLKCNTPMHCNPDEKLDPNRSAKDTDMVQAYIDAYANVCKKNVKKVRVETIGQSYLGHPVRAIVLSSADQPEQVPRVLFNGAHHGMELLATDMAFDVLEELCENTEPATRQHYDDLLSKTEVWIIPLVNFDGNDLFFHVSIHLGRKNGRNVFMHAPRKDAFPQKVGASRASAYYRFHPNDIALGAGVDINRNYPLKWGATGEKASSGNPRHYWYRGSAPASEPEIQNMMNLFHTTQFAASISFHTVSTRILPSYSIDELNNPPHEKDKLWQLGLRMAANAGVQANGEKYQVVKNLYSVDGTDQDWFRMISGTYAYLIEGPLHNPVGEKRRKAVERNRPAWVTLLEAAQQATHISVVDTNGNPLVAEVKYSDEPQLNNERWYTTYNGTHDMLCTEDRDITVTLINGDSQTKRVPCIKNNVSHDVFTFNRPDNYDALTTIHPITLSLFSVDTFCDLRNQTSPHLPANRYCLIDQQCIPAGQQKDSKLHCNPIENNRDWSRN